MEHSDMVDVNRTKLFPTSIYTFKSGLEDKHEEMMASIDGDLKANYKDIHNGKDVAFGLFQGRDDLQNFHSFKPFAEFVSHLCGGILNQEGYANQEIEITQMWANQQVDGSIHPPHTHANSLL